MAVLRFEPFRDPFDRLMSLAATGTRTPLGMPIDIYRSVTTATTASSPPASRHWDPDQPETGASGPGMVTEVPGTGDIQP